MLIEERDKDEDTGSDGANSLPKLELSYSAGVYFFLLKQAKRTIINLKIKNLPPNLEKNRFKGKKHMGIYERKVDMVEPLKAVLISTPMGGLNKGKGRR